MKPPETMPAPTPLAPTPLGYAEWVAASHFSFLRGASSPRDMVVQALQLGLNGIGIADRNTLAGVVRAHGALRDLRANGLLSPLRRRVGSAPGEVTWEKADLPGAQADHEAFVALMRERAKTFQLAVGARLSFADSTPDIVAYPQNRLGWGRLTRLLTLGNRRARKGACELTQADLLEHAQDLALIICPPETPGADNAAPMLGNCLDELVAQTRGHVWLGARMGFQGKDRRALLARRQLADQWGIGLLACQDALYTDPGQRDLQDVLSCIRLKTSIQAAGRALEVNAERHLKTPHEMMRLFRDCPEAIAQTQRLRAAIRFSLDELRYEYPDEPVPSGHTPQGWLEEITWQSARKCYPQGLPPKVEANLRDELALIARMEYAPYFLTVHDIVCFARARGILAQGRGSAANSAVCYVLGITAVDPNAHDLLFARFISAERREPPDIDVDFEHERREEVIQYIYERYGRERAGIAATVISYRPRSAIREVGKALGLSEDVTGRLASSHWGSWGREVTDTHVRQAGFSPQNGQVRRAIVLAQRLMGFPRHLSQHVGGFVLTRGRLDELVPIGNAAMEQRTFIEWDKDDIDTLGLMKVDVLALGMLTCIRKAFTLMERHLGIVHDLASVPQECPSVYDMLCRGDSVGVFQVESRAQMNMLPRMKPRTFYDLVIEVAIVRPGPIQGDMVHPYLRRRAGLEPVEFPSPDPAHGPPDELHQVLAKTKGVPLFQEQAMRLAMVAARFSDEEANQLRRAMATFRHVGTIGLFEEMMVTRMVARGYQRDFAQRCFEQIKGFGSYGFPESHAASFAKLVYVSSWLKCHHPGVFACALLNAQPMGFYAPAQIIGDARAHGVQVLPVDVNASEWDNILVMPAPTGEHGGPAPAPALRLGFRQIDGFHEAWARAMVAVRPAEGFASLESLRQATNMPQRAFDLLAQADGLGSLKLSRRGAGWAVARLPGPAPLPLFAASQANELGREEPCDLPVMAQAEEVAADYQRLRLSLKGHPMEFLRARLARRGVLTCADAQARTDGAFVRAAGIVLVRQRPGNGKAIFITLEDETGIANLVLWSRQFERFRKEVMGAQLMVAEGRLQRSPEGVVHLMTSRVFDTSYLLAALFEPGSPRLPLSADPSEPAMLQGTARHPRDVRVLPNSRDFH